MLRLLLELAVVGVIFYLIETYLPMTPPIKVIVRIVAVVIAILLLLRAFTILGVPTPSL